MLIGMESLPGTPKMREPPSNALGHREPSGMRRGLRCFQRADGRLLVYRADGRGLYPIGPDWLWANVPSDRRESRSELKEAAGNEAIERSSLTEFRENGIC